MTDDRLKLSAARVTALRVLDLTTQPCRYSNATSYERGTVESRAADWLSLRGYVRITDPTKHQRRKGDHRMIVAITDAGRAALHGDDEGGPGGDEGPPAGADSPSTNG